MKICKTRQTFEVIRKKLEDTHRSWKTQIAPKQGIKGPDKMVNPMWANTCISG